VQLLNGKEASKETPKEIQEEKVEEKKTEKKSISLPSSLPNKPVDIGLSMEEFPHLQRSVVLTYRGRIIRQEDHQDGQPRYIDDAAIFVGRLVKEQENTMSLLKRFERYGKIVSCVPTGRS
jgi:hypothetical protein